LLLETVNVLTVLSQLDMRPHALLTAEQSMAIDDAFDLADDGLDLGLL
jgi:hypothetical protein